MLVAGHAFAQEEEDIPPPQASPETGEMVKVPEDEGQVAEPPRAKPAPRPATPKPAPAQRPSSAKPAAKPAAKFVPVESSEDEESATSAPSLNTLADPTAGPIGELPSVTPAAKPKAAPRSQKAVVIVEEATIFKDPNFDGEVIGSAKGGQVFMISIGKKEMFYKIRLKPGVTGWVSDADIRPIGAAGAAAQKTPAKPGDKKKAGKKDPKQAAAEKKKAPKKGKPIQLNRYRGLAIEFINFTEDTMGKVRSASLPFYGFRWTGQNTLMGPESYIDSEILFHTGAPSYYEDATGNSAGGFILTGNFLFVTDVPQSRNVMAYYGFGPMFRFSQFHAKLSNVPTNGKTKEFEMADASIGGLIAGGVAVAISDKYAVRLDGRYYWETQRYTAFSLAIQMEW